MVDPDIKVHMLGTYVALRRLMAFVTFAFLAILTGYRHLGNDTERNSISAYFYHPDVGFPMKDIFVATLVAIGLLLIAYQGYRNLEKHALNVAGFFLMCVVFFPMDDPNIANSTGKPAPTSWHAWIHYASALIFFGSIAYVCICRAQDTLAVVSSPKRRAAYKWTYKLIGWLMILVPILALVLNFVFELKSTVFWVEFIGVAVFLMYWVVKSFELELTEVETQDKLDMLPKAPDGPAAK